MVRLEKGSMSWDSLSSGLPRSFSSARKSFRSDLICFLLIGTGCNVAIGAIGDSQPFL